MQTCQRPVYWSTCHPVYQQHERLQCYTVYRPMVPDLPGAVLLPTCQPVLRDALPDGVLHGPAAGVPDVPGTRPWCTYHPVQPGARAGTSATRSTSPCHVLPGAGLPLLATRRSTSSTSRSSATSCHRPVTQKYQVPVCYTTCQPVTENYVRTCSSGTARSSEKRPFCYQTCRMEQVTPQVPVCVQTGCWKTVAGVRPRRRSSTSRTAMPGTVALSTPARAGRTTAPARWSAARCSAPARRSCSAGVVPSTEDEWCPQTTCVPRMETHTAMATYCRNRALLHHAPGLLHDTRMVPRAARARW